jgi:hypothetical protein
VAGWVQRVACCWDDSWDAGISLVVGGGGAVYSLIPCYRTGSFEVMEKLRGSV